MIEEKRKRGRPRISENSATSNSDTIIAKTVYRLLMVGFSMRNSKDEVGIAEQCALAAKISLQRTDSNGLPLSGDRIEQIYEKWFKQINRDHNPNSWPIPKRWRYTKESLRLRCPIKDLPFSELVTLLINNMGEWPDRPHPQVPSEDLVLTQRAWKELGPIPKIILTIDDPEK